MHVELKTSMMELTTLGIHGFLSEPLMQCKLSIGCKAPPFYLQSNFIFPTCFLCALRTACVIAVAKARDTFEPFLYQVTSNIFFS